MPEIVSATLDSLVEVIGIRDAGNLSDERLLLKCKQTTNIGNIVILTGKLSGDTSVTPNRDNVYWLPDGEVTTGEYIRIYSKDGKNQKADGKYGDDPAVFHNFYWGRTSPVWVANDAAIILTVQEWKLHKVKE